MPLIEILADISPGLVDDQWLIRLARSGGRRLLTVGKTRMLLENPIGPAYSGVLGYVGRRISSCSM